MAGLSITISPSSTAIKDINQLVGRIEQPARFYAGASQLMYRQTMGHFKAKASPEGKAWRPHSNQTRSRTGVLLEDSLDLRGGIHAAPTTSMARVRTADLPYAAIHNEGGKAGRGKSVTIPARTYMGFSDKGIKEITDLAQSMIFMGK